jgi:hypothetical protein
MTESEYLVLMNMVVAEVDASFTLYHGLDELERLTKHDKKILAHVMANAEFWQPYRAVMQFTMIMTLAKIFDKASDAFTIQKLIAATIANPQFFSRDALAARRTTTGPKPEWLDDFIARAWEPRNASALRFLKQELNPHVTEFQRIYTLIRDKIYAHRLITDEQAGNDLFPQTNAKELGRTVQFLYQLVRAIRDLYNNGTKPAPEEQPFEHDEKRDRQKVARMLRKYSGSKQKNG